MTTLRRQMIAAERQRRLCDVWTDEAPTDFEVAAARTRVVAQLESPALPMSTRLIDIVACTMIGVIYLGGAAAFVLTERHTGVEQVPRVQTGIKAASIVAADRAASMAEASRERDED